jgi:hypothetical protein
MSSLSDFGGGYEPDSPNPEDETNKKLSQWLAQQEKTQIYWDRKKSYGHGTFSVSTTTTPDLVVTSAANNYAVEVKREEQTGEIYKSLPQLVGYWKAVETSDAIYRVNGNRIEIDAVILATGGSPKGHIFSNQNGLDPRRTGRSSGDNDSRGENYPTVEHAGSQSFMRAFYQWAKAENNRLDVNSTVGIGSLYSSALEGDSPGVKSSIPAAFHLVPGGDQVTTQNWDFIPYYKQDND